MFGPFFRTVTPAFEKAGNMGILVEKPHVQREQYYCREGRSQDWVN